MSYCIVLKLCIIFLCMTKKMLIDCQELKFLVKKV